MSFVEHLNARYFDGALSSVGSALERGGFDERAVEILQRHGYHAWINAIGHIAIDPAVTP